MYLFVYRPAFQTYPPCVLLSPFSISPLDLMHRDYAVQLARALLIADLTATPKIVVRTLTFATRPYVHLYARRMPLFKLLPRVRFKPISHLFERSIGIIRGCPFSKPSCPFVTSMLSETHCHFEINPTYLSGVSPFRSLHPLPVALQLAAPANTRRFPPRATCFPRYFSTLLRQFFGLY